MTQESSALAPAPREGSIFRAIVGLLCVVGSMVGFGGLYFVEIPAGNRDALMLALGIVFGWGSAVVQSEYGASTTGRKAANAAIDQIGGKP
jgi:hypothetical protein